MKIKEQIKTLKKSRKKHRKKNERTLTNKIIDKACSDTSLVDKFFPLVK